MAKKKRSAVDSIKDQTAHVAKLEADLKTTRRERDNALKKVGNWDAMVRAFVEQAPALPTSKPVKIAGRPTGDARELVCLLSDTHANERWTLKQTDGLTYYDFDRFCQLLWYYAEEIIKWALAERSRHGMKVLHVDVLGDILHGTLRMEDEVTNEFASSPAIVNTAAVTWQWLSMLSQHFERVIVTAVPGNHGRNHKKPQSKRYVEENKDTLIYLLWRQFAIESGAKHIRIRLPKSRIHTFDRLGHRVRVAHGDHIKGGNGIAGIPIFGLSRDMLRSFRKALKAESVDGKKLGIDIMEMGHFHTSTMLEDMLLMNGAGCPTGPWALEELGVMGDPKQWVYETGRKYVRGKMCDLSLKNATTHSFAYDDVTATNSAEYLETPWT